MSISVAQFRQISDRSKCFRPRPRHKPKVMNNLESAYAEILEAQKRCGIIIDYKFEALKFRLADKTYYTPDFLVITSLGIEIHETKGFMRDDANVKIKVAAETFWWAKFVLVTREKKQWKFKFYD